MPSRFARAAAPRLLYSLLATVERVDRRVRRVRPIYPGALLAIEQSSHRGAALTLRDGARVIPGDRIVVIHFDNRVLRQLSNAMSLHAGLRRAVAELSPLADALDRLPPDRRPVAVRGTTILGPLLRRAGWEVRPRRRTAWHAIEDWYLRTLLARWSAEGPSRLRRGHGELRAIEGWLSLAELRRVADARSHRGAAAGNG
jgi:hypothetical protein